MYQSHSLKRKKSILTSFWTLCSTFYQTAHFISRFCGLS